MKEGKGGRIRTAVIAQSIEYKYKKKSPRSGLTLPFLGVCGDVGVNKPTLPPEDESRTYTITVVGWTTQV